MQFHARFSSLGNNLRIKFKTNYYRTLSKSVGLPNFFDSPIALT